MCEEEKKEKKFSFLLLIWYGLLAYIAVALTIYEIIPHGMNMIRKTNIIKDLESIYTDADIVAIKCDVEPFDKEELAGRYLWFGNGLPEEDLYAFVFADSEDNIGRGYATRYGTVVFDTYAACYYWDEMIASFEEIVDFEYNFPGLYHHILEDTLVNDCRLVYTHDCTTYEGFLAAGTIGYFYFGSGGYPGLTVGLSDASKETREAINKVLSESEFSIYIIYRPLKDEVIDEENAFLYYDSICGSYYPFDAPYNEAILGE